MLTENGKNNKGSEKKNKGEFAEFYAFLKLLLDGKLRGKKIRYIKRFETGNPKAVMYVPWVNGIILIDGVPVSIPDFDALLTVFFSEIINGRGRSFYSNSAIALSQALAINNIKAGSDDKDDFMIKYEDSEDEEPLDGYDVKADFAAPPCIINASLPTNFVFEVSRENGAGVSFVDFSNFNSIISMGKAQKGRLKLAMNGLVGAGYQLSFSPSHPDNDPPKKGNELYHRFSTDERDLIPKLLVEYFSTKGIKVKEVLVHFAGKNPKYLENFWIWEEQVKNVLLKGYRGYYNKKRNQINKERLEHSFAGSISVLRDGSLVLEPKDSKQTLEETLFNRCQFDTGSLTKHKFGMLYQVAGKTYIKLNFSVKLSKSGKKKNVKPKFSVVNYSNLVSV